VEISAVSCRIYILETGRQFVVDFGVAYPWILRGSY
jgi:hypothetical protein